MTVSCGIASFHFYREYIMSLNRRCLPVMIFIFTFGQSAITKNPADVVVKKIWETPPVFRTPEAVILDQKRRHLYVSNFNVKGGFVSRGDTTRDEFISKVSLNGDIIDLKWAGGLLNPTGMAMYGDRLYVVERKGIVEIDPENGGITGRYPVPASLFLNDIAFDAGGRAYVTDNDRRAGVTVYLVENGAVTPYLSSRDITRPNGIVMVKDTLIAGDLSTNSLIAIWDAGRGRRALASVDSIMTFDGVQSCGGGAYLFSDFTGTGWYAGPEGHVTEIFDMRTFTSGQRPTVNSADMAFVPERKLLVIPTFMDNRLVAFELESNEN